jgi:hypothetical protein
VTIILTRDDEPFDALLKAHLLKDIHQLFFTLIGGLEVSAIGSKA